MLRQEHALALHDLKIRFLLVYFLSILALAFSVFLPEPLDGFSLKFKDYFMQAAREPPQEGLAAQMQQVRC